MARILKCSNNLQGVTTKRSCRFCEHVNYEQTGTALGRSHLPPTTVFRRLKTMHASLLRRAPNKPCPWDFPDVIEFRVAVHTISQKAIRFGHLDYDPDFAQKLISSSMSRQLWTRKMSFKSIHAFLSNLANRQTDKHCGQSHLPPPLSEIN